MKIFMETFTGLPLLFTDLLTISTKQCGAHNRPTRKGRSAAVRRPFKLRFVQCTYTHLSPSLRKMTALSRVSLLQNTERHGNHFCKPLPPDVFRVNSECGTIGQVLNLLECFCYRYRWTGRSKVSVNNFFTAAPATCQFNLV